MKYIVPTLYIIAVLLANLTAATFIQLPLFGITAVGTLFFGAIFTLRDYAHKQGRPFVYRMIAIAALVNLAATVALGVPLRIVAASFISILISEAVDTEIFQALLKKSWLFRMFSSNAVSIPVDTILFTTIAFAGVLSFTEFNALLYGDTLVKYVIASFVGFAYFGLSKPVQSSVS